MNKTLGAMLVVILVATAGAYLFPKVQKPLGSLPGPDITSPYLSWGDGGVVQWAASRPLNQASTTICSMRSPSATSTLVYGSVQLTTGTTTAIALELAKSTLFDATTTRIAYDSALASGAQETLTAFVASTTGVYGALGQQHTADEQDLVFAPNTYLNAKYGGALGTTNTLKGLCTAVWVQN